MHDPGDAGPQGSDDRQAVPVVSKDDHGVGQGIAAGLQHLVEHPRDFGAAPPETAPDRGELGRRVAAVGPQNACRRIDQRLEIGETCRAVAKLRRLCPVERAADGVGRPGRREDRAEVFGRRSAAGVLERRQGGGDVLQPGQGKASLARDELAQVGNFFEAPADGCLVPGRCRSENGLPAGRRTGEGGNQSEDDVEFEGAEIDAVLLPRGGYGVARRSSESLRSIFLRAWIALRFRFALGFS